MTPDSHGQARRLRRILDSLGDPVATLILPGPAHPGRHARQQLGNVDRFSFHDTLNNPGAE